MQLRTFHSLLSCQAAVQLRRCCNDWHHTDKHQKSGDHRSRNAQTQAEMFSLLAPHLLWDAEVPIIFLIPEVFFFFLISFNS